MDVGANFGWYSLVVAALGCPVIGFEPVPHFHAFFEYSAHLNQFAHLIDIRRQVVSNASGVELEMVRSFFLFCLSVFLYEDATETMLLSTHQLQQYL